MTPKLNQFLNQDESGSGSSEEGEERNRQKFPTTTHNRNANNNDNNAEEVPTPNISNSKKVSCLKDSSPQNRNGNGNGTDNNSSNSSSSRSSDRKGYTADCSSLSNCSDSSDTSNSNNNSNSNNISRTQSTKMTRPSSKGKSGHKGKSAFQSKSQNPLAPIWQGVRVLNPMDPRIDLSSVNFIPDSKLVNHTDPQDLTDGRGDTPQHVTHRNGNDPSNSNLNQSSLDQEIRGGEVKVAAPAESEENNIIFINEYSDLINSLQGDRSIQALAQSHCEMVNMNNAHEDDSESSMKVLARVKRKYQKDTLLPDQEVKEQVINISYRKTNPNDDSTGAISSSLSSRSSRNNENKRQVHGLIMNEKAVQSTEQKIGNQQNSIVTDSVGVSGGTGTGTTVSTGSDQATTTDEKVKVNAAEFDEAATLERLALKKRKRLDKRREYEEEVQRQLQDSSDDYNETEFKGGEMISMEEALSFANTARLVVQSLEPYLAVHVNAAFSRLTGIHNSGIIGRPLSRILSLLGNNEWNAVNKDKLSPSTTSKGNDDSNNDIQEQNSRTIDKLMAQSDFDNKYYLVTTIVDKGDDKGSDKSNSANEGSNNSSITSKEDSYTPMKCLISICSILSAPPRGRSSKSRKYEGHEMPYSRMKDTKMVISHYLIQLKPTSQHDDSSGSMGDKIKDERATSAEESANSNSNSNSSHAKTCG
jgi:hypothetical protein